MRDDDPTDIIVIAMQMKRIARGFTILATFTLPLWGFLLAMLWALEGPGKWLAIAALEVLMFAELYAGYRLNLEARKAEDRFFRWMKDRGYLLEEDGG